MNKLKTFAALFILIFISVACSKLTDLTKGDHLYFCEKYTPSTDKCEGKTSKYTTGTLTVMVKLSKPIGVSSVDINITELATGKAVDTQPFNVPSNENYIYFPEVNFREPGKYKVSCLKKDGTVVASNEIEITNK